MKKTALTVIIFIISSFLVSAQHSCCNSATHAETAMISDPSFIASHADPLPLNFVASSGGMITFDTPDGKKANAFYARVKDSKNVIFMFHEWWGLNVYIKREAERLSEQTGASVLAVDLYDGEVADNAEDASKLMEKVDETRIRTIISGAIDFCGKDSRIQTIGWCFGGKWSLQAALMAGPNAVGCVMYYGFPEQDKNNLMKLSCPLVGFFAKQDDWITPKVVKDFESMLHELKKSVTIYNYDAVHAFANPSNPKYDKVAADDAMIKAV
ncbi:MAG: dienelactone hydrolase family protein, partial [Bacteroidota bacterium]